MTFGGFCVQFRKLRFFFFFPLWEFITIILVMVAV